MKQATAESWSIPLASAAALAGVSESLVRALIGQRILSGVETASGPAVTIASLVRWLNERHDSLRFAPRVRPYETRATREE